MGFQGDLFADRDAGTVGLPEGMSLWRDFVTPAEEHELAAAVDAAPLAPFQFHQRQGKRLTASYGRGYDFSRGEMVETPTFPAWLRDFADRAAGHAGIAPETVAQGLVIRYDPGSGIGWHRDRPQFGTVLGLSLTSKVVLRLRRRLPNGFERRSVVLPPRSLYRLEGPARWDWGHSIVPVAETRRSITLRTLHRSV
jgi:alkylated DNA repair dioxygenase AlkB